MIEDDAALLAIARANRSRRKFNMTLKELSLQIIARNETIFVTSAGLSALFYYLDLSLKTQILAELSKQVFGHPRYPASKDRVKVLQMLIHPQLEEFDFAACGDKFGKMATQQVWKYLAANAGKSLLCVKDMRIKSHAQKARTLAWCLPYLSHMPHLEELRLTTLSCFPGELEKLVKSAPRLRVLQLLLYKTVGPEEVEPIPALKGLEELALYSYNGYESTFVPRLLKDMPQLKINCLQADKIYPPGYEIYHDINSLDSNQTLNLEHFSMTNDFHPEDQLSHVQLSRVKHLMRTSSSRHNSSPKVHDYSKIFGQLQSIHFRGCEFDFAIAPSLRVSGRSITSLILDSKAVMESGLLTNCFEIYNIYTVLECCPNLNSLTANRLNMAEPPSLQHRFYLPLRLKKLHLICCDIDSELLGWVFMNAPMLEVIEFDSLFEVHGITYQRATEVVATGCCLANLHSFKLAVNFHAYQITHQLHIHQSYNFAKTMLSYCPNLRSAAVDLRGGAECEIADWRKIDKFLDLINV